MSADDKLDAFQVPLRVHLLSSLVNRHPRWWVKLGQLESLSLREELDAVEIDRPVYVSGIARAGTTILLELLNRHPELGSHRYRDFPGVFVPTWWNRGQSSTPLTPQQRAHGDRLQVTQDSPEAMEEPLWMTFFPAAHRSDVSNVLDRSTSNPEFEQFYRDHIRKLLSVRHRRRYLAKGNYNLTRLAYLQKMMPSARFVVVVRHPRDHIASLIKQHRLFCAGQEKYPRALAHMQHVGHFEFGFDRRAICVGDSLAQEVMQLWDQGEEVRGSARHWASIYGWLYQQLQQDEQLREATTIVRYEELCSDPQETVDTILAHCQLEPTPEITEFAAGISAPTYYSPEFTEREEAIIVEETASVAERFSYLEEASGLAGESLACAVS